MAEKAPISTVSGEAIVGRSRVGLVGHHLHDVLEPFRSIVDGWSRVLLWHGWKSLLGQVCFVLLLLQNLIHLGDLLSCDVRGLRVNYLWVEGGPQNCANEFRSVGSFEDNRACHRVLRLSIHRILDRSHLSVGRIGLDSAAGLFLLRRVLEFLQFILRQLLFNLL